MGQTFTIGVVKAFEPDDEFRFYHFIQRGSAVKVPTTKEKQQQLLKVALKGCLNETAKKPLFS